jgi:hypothetical protein
LENEISGGWRIIKRKDGTTEKRFFPLTIKKKKQAHCKSCLYYRKGYGGYCANQPNLIIHSETEACRHYVNRNKSLIGFRGDVGE